MSTLAYNFRKQYMKPLFMVDIETIYCGKSFDQTRLLCHQLTHQRQHQRTEQRQDQIQRIQRPREIQTTTALEGTLRLAYLSARRRTLTSTRYITTSCDINLLKIPMCLPPGVCPWLHGELLSGKICREWNIFTKVNSCCVALVTLLQCWGVLAW